MAKRGGKGRRKSGDESICVPQPFSDIIDQVCDQDKKYFEEHPDHGFYVRRYAPGEFWPFIFPDDIWVIIRQILPGLRIRSLGIIANVDAEKWKRLLEKGRPIPSVSIEENIIGEVQPR